MIDECVNICHAMELFVFIEPTAEKITFQPTAEKITFNGSILLLNPEF